MKLSDQNHPRPPTPPSHPITLHPGWGGVGCHGAPTCCWWWWDEWRQDVGQWDEGSSAAGSTAAGSGMHIHKTQDMWPQDAGLQTHGHRIPGIWDAQLQDAGPQGPGYVAAGCRMHSHGIQDVHLWDAGHTTARSETQGCRIWDAGPWDARDAGCAVAATCAAGGSPEGCACGQAPALQPPPDPPL